MVCHSGEVPRYCRNWAANPSDVVTCEGLVVLLNTYWLDVIPGNVVKNLNATVLSAVETLDGFVSAKMTVEFALILGKAAISAASQSLTPSPFVSFAVTT